MFFSQRKCGKEQYFKITFLELYQSNVSKFVFYALTQPTQRRRKDVIKTS